MIRLYVLRTELDIIIKSLMEHAVTLDLESHNNPEPPAEEYSQTIKIAAELTNIKESLNVVQSS